MSARQFQRMPAATVQPPSSLVQFGDAAHDYASAFGALGNGGYWSQHFDARSDPTLAIIPRPDGRAAQARRTASPAPQTAAKQRSRLHRAAALGAWLVALPMRRLRATATADSTRLAG